MKVDYEKYPEIPAGCQLNYNKKTGIYQVFKEHRVYSEEKQKNVTVRETIGSIKNGEFKLSENLRLKRIIAQQEQRIAELEKGQVKAKRAQTKMSREVADKVHEAATETKVDERDPQRCTISISALLLAAIMSALTGNTDCHAIGDFVKRNKDFLGHCLPDQPVEIISHDTVRRSLMLIEPEKLEAFCKQMITPLIKHVERRVIAADGQAGRATGRTTKDNPDMHGYFMCMNFFDTNNRVCIGQKIIDRKTNEIPIGTAMIKNLDISGAVVTADAMNCQVGFANEVLSAGADYCLALKSNQDRTCKEVRNLFNTTNPDQIYVYDSGDELAHGRIERRRVGIIRGALLSKEILLKWPGLAGGCIAQVEYWSTKKSTKKTSYDQRFYLCSLPAIDTNAEWVYEAIRAHWGVENNLHWMLDMYFKQDRTQANDPTYITNRFAINKLALAMLEHYRFWLWDTGRENELLSINLIQQRCTNPQTAIECIACALGQL